jgi:hypothetical protein
VERIGHDFIRAEELSFYGLADTGLLDSMIYTATNVLIAVALGSATGTLDGLVAARFHLVRAVLDPIVMTTGTVPILVLAPFFRIWFGVDRMSALLLVAIYVGVILYVFAQRAADNIDPVYEESAYTLGATRRRVVWDILISGPLLGMNLSLHLAPEGHAQPKRDRFLPDLDTRGPERGRRPFRVRASLSVAVRRNRCAEHATASSLRPRVRSCDTSNTQLGCCHLDRTCRLARR